MSTPKKPGFNKNIGIALGFVVVIIVILAVFVPHLLPATSIKYDEDFEKYPIGYIPSTNDNWFVRNQDPTINFFKVDYGISGKSGMMKKESVASFDSFQVLFNMGEQPKANEGTVSMDILLSRIPGGSGIGVQLGWVGNSGNLMIIQFGIDGYISVYSGSLSQPVNTNIRFEANKIYTISCTKKNLMQFTISINGIDVEKVFTTWGSRIDPVTKATVYIHISTISGTVKFDNLYSSWNQI